jgi:flagellar hook assembly protein FlgD
VLFLAPPSNGVAASAATVTIYAPDGNRIRSLFDGTMPAGRNELFWDGRNDRGNAVAAGVYFAVAETQWDTFKRKLILVR